jgi:hypothetical protein
MLSASSMVKIYQHLSAPPSSAVEILPSWFTRVPAFWLSGAGQGGKRADRDFRKARGHGQWFNLQREIFEN